MTEVISSMNISTGEQGRDGPPGPAGSPGNNGRQLIGRPGAKVFILNGREPMRIGALCRATVENAVQRASPAQRAPTPVQAKRAQPAPRDVPVCKAQPVSAATKDLRASRESQVRH